MKNNMAPSLRNELLFRLMPLVALTFLVLASAAGAAGKDDIELPASAEKRILEKTNAKQVVDIHDLVFRRTQDADYLAVSITLEIEWGFESWYHITLIMEKPSEESGWQNARLYTSELDITELFNRPYEDFKYSLEPYGENTSPETPTSTDGNSGACATVHEKPIAIFIDPTDDELEAMRKENSEEDFYTITDDVMYYNAQAMDFLKQRDIPYCFTTEEAHEFVTPEGKRYSVNEECKYWCLLLWNGSAEPVSASTVDISMYETYLKRDE